MTSLPHVPPAPTAPPADLAAALSGRYSLERELGRGGMGVVYLARDLVLERLVALKVLPGGAPQGAVTRARFLREARTAAQLAHPNVVPVYHADAVGDHAYFAMAYVEGESLAERVRARGPLPAAEAVRYLREVAWALAYAHARGVIHRDVKPENILVERASGRALVTDFGIARDSLAAAEGLTATGHVLGTVHFMSPEQAAGDALDGRSDLYALGVVGFYLLSGQLPFSAGTAAAVLVAHATRPAPPLASVAPTVPRRLADVIDRCLAKDPAGRPANGEALAEALDAALADADATAPDATGEVVLSEAQAAALWRRAAQLQADALSRLDAAAAGPALAAGAGAGGSTRNAPDAYRLRHVQAAAAEAGISAQFVALALAELPAGGATGVEAARGLAPDAWQERRATRLLGTAERSCAVTRVAAAPPARVLRSLGLILQQSPWELTLKEPVGGHPLDGGVLVFDLPGGLDLMGFGEPASYPWRAVRVMLRAAQVQVTLREAPGTPGSCEVTMYADLRPGVRQNLNGAVFTGGAVGTLGGLVGLAAGVKSIAAIGAAAVAIPALGMGSVAALGAFAFYRASYRGAVAKAQGELGRALDAVLASLRSEDLFGSTPHPRQPGQRQVGGGGDAAVIAGIP